MPAGVRPAGRPCKRSTNGRHIATIHGPWKVARRRSPQAGVGRRSAHAGRSGQEWPRFCRYCCRPWRHPHSPVPCACSRLPICSASAPTRCVAGPTRGRIACQRSPSDQRRFLADDLEALVVGAARRDGPQPRPGGAEQRYQLLFETSLELASSLEPTEVLQSAARRLSAALDTPDCDIYRQEDDRAHGLRGLQRRRRLQRVLGGPGVPPEGLALRPARRRVAAGRHRAQPRRPATEQGGTRGDGPQRPPKLGLSAADRPRQGHRSGRLARPRRTPVHRRGDRHRRGGQPARGSRHGARRALRGGQEPPPGQPAGPQFGT